ncbi:MAG: hypothetical protein VYD51_07340 [Bacteroidota bacterium]|nr:hypothetical protein [Bacteroidota bacterium]
MKWIPLALGLTAALATGCSKTTVRSTQLAQGAALDIQAIRMMRFRLGMTF